MLDLWLVRHGETTWNKEKRIQGQLGAPLSDLGVRQVKALRKRLSRQSFDMVYSSDSGRAVQTANILFPNKELCLDKRLREMHWGVLEGKTRAEFTPEEEAVYLSYKRNPYDYQLPEGENWQLISERFNDWVTSLPEAGRVVAITHGGVVRASLRWLVDQPKTYEWNVQIDNASISRFYISDQKVLITFNDAGHLEGVEDYDD